jgi:Xaa-Pro aminopeptidase
MGHGVGVEIHEQPFCGPNSKGILQAGNVVSCEPGIYLEGKFGVRIEDMLLITPEGSMNFCHLPKDLQVLGA